MNFIAGEEKRFYEFMGNLNEKDKIAIFAHTDPDGISSAVIVSKVLGKIDFLRFVNYKKGVYTSFIPELKKKKINKIFFLDLVLDSDVESIKEIEKFAEVVVIDHHPFENDLNSARTIFLASASEYPAAYMCYYLFSKIQNILEWIPAIGIIADRPQVYNEKNSRQVYKDFNLKNERDLWNVVSDFSFALIYLDKNLKKSYDLLFNSRDEREVLEKCEKLADPVKKEFQEYIERFDREKEVYGDLVIFYLAPKYRIKSLLINVLSVKDNDKTYVFIAERELLSISVRSQNGGIDCIKLMKEAGKDIPEFFSGGHVKAVGGSFPKKYLSKFRENLIKAYSRMRS